MNSRAIFQGNGVSLLLCPEQTLNELRPQQCVPPPLPPSHPGIAMHSHVSLVIVADFLDSDVILGVDEWLGGGVGSCHGYNARHVPEVVLVLNFDLDCRKSSKNMTSAKRTGILCEWKSFP